MTMEYKGECGCKVTVEVSNVADIEEMRIIQINYCPLHKAAPALHKACEAIAYMWREDTSAYRGQKQEAEELLAIALAKVEEK